MYHRTFSPSLLSNLSSSSELSSSSMGFSTTRTCKSAPPIFHAKYKNDFYNHFICTAFQSHHASRCFEGRLI